MTGTKTDLTQSSQTSESTAPSSSSRLELGRRENELFLKMAQNPIPMAPDLEEPPSPTDYLWTEVEGETEEQTLAGEMRAEAIRRLKVTRMMEQAKIKRS